MFSSTPDKLDKERLKKNKASLSDELTIWDGYVKQTGAYVAGKRFTMADAMFFPSFAFLVRMGLKLNPKYPHLARYYDDTRNRESVKKTWPPHWKGSEGKDILKDV
ncbi:unnamed protein product [Owenia fusiformis]|uniref:Uncharacterized protein n=1 Tax=Owenia fusiformis TaxID=6347 RepID=A0A8J1TUQ9_OWEFU|nr:unnamed protein product [Owenia fusiformis]